MQFQININLKSDFVRIIKKRLKILKRFQPSINYKNQIKDLNNSTEICIKYLNLQNRLIQNIPRNILKSKEFSCPPDKKGAIQLIEQKIKNGEDLTPFLSRLLKKFDYNDLFLNDWGIYHLHLNITVESDGFIKRSGPVLLVRFDKSKAYFIQIKEHSSKFNLWHQKQLIEIIHQNWPDTIADKRISIKTTNSISNEDRKKWRKGGINTVISVNDGTTYALIGGGITLSNNNLQNVRYTYFILNILDEIENYLNLNIEEICRKIKQKGGEIGKILRFTLYDISLYSIPIESCLIELNSRHCLIFYNNNLVKGNIYKS